MQKFDVSYRLEDESASLVAQHVPQVRPDLPWQPEEAPAPELRRLAMACVMDDAPPGLVPWMIVRTHPYACEMRCADGQEHRLHWQRGMFLRNHSHGTAMLELRGREFHVYTEAVWPLYFMEVLQRTLEKLITDHWPGLQGRYYYAVPCAERVDGRPCDGRFDIAALHQFLAEGDEYIRCQVCRKRQSIIELLYGFEEQDPREQLAQLEEKMERGFVEVQRRIVGLHSRLSSYVMGIMHAIADEAKRGPRLFTIEPVDGDWRRWVAKRYRVRLWCEAEGCQHPVLEPGLGVYEFEATREWVRGVAPYINFVGGMLKTLLPMVTPAVDAAFGADTIKNLGIKAHVDLMKAMTSRLDEVDVTGPRPGEGVLSGAERSGLLALHALLQEKDPHQERLGLKRMPTYTGDYLWLCERHYREAEPQIPDRIE